MMRPISRIPKTDSSHSLAELFQIEQIQNRDAADAMTELVSHSKGNPYHINCCLDWAMEIRDSLGIDWGTAIEFAMRMYFG